MQLKIKCSIIALIATFNLCFDFHVMQSLLVTATARLSQAISQRFIARKAPGMIMTSKYGSHGYALGNSGVYVSKLGVSWR